MESGSSEKLAAFISAENLPASYPELVETWLVPLANWLAARRSAQGKTLLVGLHGGQGTGKTTLCRVLEILLAETGLHCQTLSLDDFYLARDERLALAEQVHPLLATRGVPGTHDLRLLSTTLRALERGKSVVLPRFNKAEDERELPANWVEVAAGVDVILLEGWCIGCRAQPNAELETPINALEASEDPDGRWRRYVNDCLAGPYAELQAKLDYLVMLCAPSMEAVLEWRALQERKLAEQGGSQVMSDKEIQRFVQHYERLTRHALAEMPLRADYQLRLDADHKFIESSAR